MCRTGPGRKCTAPAAPTILEDPACARVHEARKRGTTLPATNLRGLIAFIICPAKAGAITAPAVTAPNTKRASMLINRPNEPRATA